MYGYLRVPKGLRPSCFDSPARDAFMIQPIAKSCWRSIPPWGGVCPYGWGAVRSLFTFRKCFHDFRSCSLRNSEFSIPGFLFEIPSFSLCPLDSASEFGLVSGIYPLIRKGRKPPQPTPALRVGKRVSTTFCSSNHARRSRCNYSSELRGPIRSLQPSRPASDQLAPANRCIERCRLGFSHQVTCDTKQGG